MLQVIEAYLGVVASQEVRLNELNVRGSKSM